VSADIAWWCNICQIGHQLTVCLAYLLQFPSARVNPVYSLGAGSALAGQWSSSHLCCESACGLLWSTYSIAIYYYCSAWKLILFYHPAEGRRLSQPRNCSKGAQCTVYRSGCRDKCYCPQWDLVVGSVLLQWNMLPLNYWGLIFVMWQSWSKFAFIECKFWLPNLFQYECECRFIDL